MQGTLAQLDSQNPVLYVDFPQGRLKFLGTIIFPKNKYMLLKFGQKDVLCEDIFDNMVRSCWISMQSKYWKYWRPLCLSYERRCFMTLPILFWNLTWKTIYSELDPYGRTF